MLTLLSRIFCVFLLCLLFSGTLLAKPLTSVASTDDIPDRKIALSLKSLGAGKPIQLRGVEGSSELSFGIRLDEVITKARLKLNYTLSPALLPTISHLKIFLNDEVLAIIPVTKEAVLAPQQFELELDPHYFTDFNRLKFQLIGHYTPDCEFPFHTSLWANISNLSTLELEYRNVKLANDLAIFPAPFFDVRDSSPVNLPFVFGTKPQLETLRVAGVLASWFGAQSSYRGAEFPVLLNALPAKHAIIIASNDERPDFLAGLPKVEAPTISVISHPKDDSIKLLLIQGRNSQDLKLAVDAITIGKATLSGSEISVGAIQYPPRRLAYDAPNWVQIGRPVRFGELVSSPYNLQSRGSWLEPISINARLPADLFTWEVKGVPIDLKYRYTPPAEQDKARLNIEINDEFVESFALYADSRNERKSKLPLLDDGTTQDRSEVTIPAFRIGSNNRLQFSFNIPPTDTGKCRSTLSGETLAAIDPDSTLDLSHFYHYAAMPNLAFFANSGFPFTKYADLAETAVVVPDQPAPADISTMLAALGRMGASTGAAASLFQLVNAQSITQVGDKDLLIIASDSQQSVLKQWNQHLPALLDNSQRSFTPLNKAINIAYDWFGFSNKLEALSSGNAILKGNGPLAAIVGFESPLASKRSVIALTATTPEAMPQLVSALEDAGKIPQIRGDLSLIRGDNLESFRINSVYYVGKLPWWRWTWFHLNQHPILLSLAGIAIGLFSALLAFSALRAVANRRLKKHH